MKSYINLINKNEQTLPSQFEDVRFTEELVEIFLKEYTNEGDVILDPFAGFGTTLLVAERLNRKAYGIEYLEDRVAYIRSLLSEPQNLLFGDALKLNEFDLPLFDFSITSPPYMHKSDPENPFKGYQATGHGYEAYLQDIKTIYTHVKQLMKPTGHVVIEVANIKGNDVTPLAWDISRVVSEVLTFKGEIIINWDHYGYGYDHSYCLVFTKES